MKRKIIIPMGANLELLDALVIAIHENPNFFADSAFAEMLARAVRCKTHNVEAENKMVETITKSLPPERDTYVLEIADGESKFKVRTAKLSDESKQVAYVEATDPVGLGMALIGL